MKLKIFDLDALDIPESLVGIVDSHILQGKIIHLTEEFRPVDDTVLHCHIVAVPDSRAGTDSEIAIRNQATVHMLPRILAVETTIIGFHIVAALDSWFSVNYLYILKTNVFYSEKRPLATELLISDNLHNHIFTVQR